MKYRNGKGLSVSQIYFLEDKPRCTPRLLSSLANWSLAYMKVFPAKSLSFERREEPAFSWPTVLSLQDFKWCSFTFNTEQNQTLVAPPFGRREFCISGKDLGLQRLGEREFTWLLWHVLAQPLLYPASTMLEVLLFSQWGQSLTSSFCALRNVWL